MKLEVVSTFEVGKKYFITYKNNDYIKFATCTVIETNQFLIKIRDKFDVEIIIGLGSIIESKKLRS